MARTFEARLKVPGHRLLSRRFWLARHSGKPADRSQQRREGGRVREPGSPNPSFYGCFSHALFLTARWLPNALRISRRRGARKNLENRSDLGRRRRSVACACWVAFSNCDRATMPQTGTRYAPTFVLPTLPRPPRGGPTAITLDSCARGHILLRAVGAWSREADEAASDPRSPNSRCLASSENFAEKCQHRGVELLRPLQRCEMTHTV